MSDPRMRKARGNVSEVRAVTDVILDGIEQYRPRLSKRDREELRHKVASTLHARPRLGRAKLSVEDAHRLITERLAKAASNPDFPADFDK